MVKKESGILLSRNIVKPMQFSDKNLLIKRSLEECSNNGTNSFQKIPSALFLPRKTTNKF